MTIATRVHRWTSRTKHAVWAFLFLTSYAVSMVSPFMPAKTASALDTGWNIPAATHSPNDWDTNTVANIQTSNNQYISESGGQEQGYSFNIPSIPANAVISGIEVSTEVRSTDNNGCRLGVALSWNGGSSYTGYQYANLGNSDATEGFGGSSDAWGRTWSVSDFSSSNFVVKLLDYDPGSQCKNATTYVDVLSVKVSYAVPVTPVANPALTQACGLDIALVIDNSNSIDATEMQSMKTALKGFTNALSGTPTQFSVTRFGTSAAVLSLFTSDVNTVNNSIDSVSTGGGGTNWEDGLLKANSTFDPRADKPNLVIFASDGNPTYHIGGGSGSSTSQADVDAAVSQANFIKGTGTRMLALGIGNDLSVDNLKAISGTNVNTGNVLTSDVITADFSTLSTQLATFATQTCGGTITVKKLVDADGNLLTTNDQTTASGWSFDINGGSNPDATTTDANGLTPAVKVSAGSGYSVSEVSQPGYSLLKASCTNATNNGYWSGGLMVNGIQVGANDIINCTFINKLDTGTVKLVKEVDNTYGGTLGVNDFGLSIGNTSVTSGQELAVPAGVPVAINEVGAAGYQFVSITGDGCPTVLGGKVTPVKDKTITCTIKNASKPATLIVKKHVVNDDNGSKTASQFTMNVTGTNVSMSSFPGIESGTTVTLKPGAYSVDEAFDAGYTKTLGSDCSGTIAVGETKTCVVTNDDISPILTLKKTVINNNGGTAEPTDWTLSATGTYTNPSIISGIHGSANITNATVKAGEYTLAESNGPAGYTSKGWACTGATLYGTKLTLEPGQNVTCTVTNDDDSPYLELVKIVTNNNGGTAEPTDWQLVATGIGSASTSSFSGTSGVNSTIVENFNAGSYTLSELGGPSGYTPSAWSCVGGSAVNDVIALVLGQRVVCTITNDDVAPTIEIIKHLSPVDDSGKFNLLIDGQTKKENASNNDTTGKVEVSAGNHTISEVAGTGTNLADYESTWVCDGPYRLSGTGSVITGAVKVGENWTCAFTNTRKTGTIKVVKKVINDDGGKKTAKDFTFTNNAGAAQHFAPTTGADGAATLVLNIGSSFSIKEVQENKDGYVTTYSGCSGTVSATPQTCTITNNDKPGIITVIKNVDDGFGHVTKDVKNWTWNYKGPNTKYGIWTGSHNGQELNAGTYTVSENQKDGYHVVASSCKSDEYHGGYGDRSYGDGYDQPSTSEKVTVGLGEHITCEFTNKRDTGMITVHKKIEDKVDPQGWTWWLEQNGTHIDMGDTEKVATGWYWFGENQKDGYSFESLKCKVDGRYVWVSQNIKAKMYVGRDDHIDCTFTNTRDTGTVTVVKDAQPDSTQGFNFTVQPVASGSGDSDDCDSVFEGAQYQEDIQQVIVGNKYNHHGHDNDGTNNPSLSFTLTDNGTNDGNNTYSAALPTGEYVISEASTDGWDLSKISCGESKVSVKDNAVYIYVTKGAHITCTFTNTQRAQLTIVKDARPDGAKSFSFTSTLPDSLGADASFSLVDDGSGAMSSKSFENLKPGTYTITETAATAWRLDSIACSGTGVTMTRDGYMLTVSLAAGAVATCTFVNTFVPQVLGESTVTPTLVNTGTDTIIAATIAVTLTAAAIFLMAQRRHAYATVRKD